MASIQYPSESPRRASYEKMSDKDASEDGDRDSGMQLPSSDEWPASVLPGCSKGKDHAKLWTMSTSMMQAYLTLKGPGNDADDPLLSWFAKQDGDGAERGEAFGMLAGIRNSIKEHYAWKVHGPATFDEDDRQTVFQYKRPKIEHITLDESFDPDLLELIYENRDKEDDGWREVASNISDDEGGPEDGRISPCTFARWAEGSTRWDTAEDKYKSMWEDRKEYEIPDGRQRPPSPNTLEPRERKRRSRKPQVDERDGEPMSAVCSEYAKTEPSILWSPPPMRFHLPHDYYTRKLDRMDPELAKALREDAMSTVVSFGLESVDELEDPANFSQTEVDEAVEKYWGRDRACQAMADKRRDLFFLHYNEETINAANERCRHDITRLRHENRKLNDCLTIHRSVRDRQIMQHVDKQMRTLGFEAKAKLAEIKARYKENRALREEYSSMKAVHGMLLKQLGKETAEEVFEMFPDVWEPLEYRKNRRNFS